MTELSFIKMQGAGNDFVIIDNRDETFSEKQIISLAPKLCHRRFGVGADGIIAMQSPKNHSVNYTMFYRNADGSNAGMCGNGARCLALYAAEVLGKTQLQFNVHDKIYKASVNLSKKSVTLRFPMQVDVQKVAVPNESTFYQCHAGTEHITREVSKAYFNDEKELIAEGQRLRYHDSFNPPGTNVNFIVGQSPSKIRIKTYERGVESLTLACGTGAIAAAVTWHHLQKEAGINAIQVSAEGGTLSVGFDYQPGADTYSNIQLKGGAHIVFEGSYQL